MRLALKLTKSLCIPHEFNTVLTVLISKPTKNCTVVSVKYASYVFKLADLMRSIKTNGASKNRD